MQANHGSTGISLGERIANMTVDDVKAAVKEDEDRHKNDGTRRTAPSDDVNTSQSVGAQFLRSVSSSCKAYGTSKEAAEYARRKCFALQDFFGMHSLFLTITPADDCCFRIRLYVNAGRTVSPKYHAISFGLTTSLTIFFSHSHTKHK